MMLVLNNKTPQSAVIPKTYFEYIRKIKILEYKLNFSKERILKTKATKRLHFVFKSPHLRQK